MDGVAAYEIHLDPTGTLLSWHRDLAEILGMPFHEFSGLTIYDLAAGDDALLLGGARFRVLAGEVPVYTRFRCEAADGGLYWFDGMDWGDRVHMRVLGRSNLALGAKMPKILLRRGPETATPWVASAYEPKTGHLVIGYSSGILTEDFWHLARDAIDRDQFARLRRLIDGLMSSDVGDFPEDPDALMRARVIPGEPL